MVDGMSSQTETQCIKNSSFIHTGLLGLNSFKNVCVQRSTTALYVDNFSLQCNAVNSTRDPVQQRFAVIASGFRTLAVVHKRIEQIILGILAHPPCTGMSAFTKWELVKTVKDSREGVARSRRFWPTSTFVVHAHGQSPRGTPVVT